MGANLFMNAANQGQNAAMQAGLANQAAAGQQQQNILRGYGQFGQLGGNLMNQAYNMGLGNLGAGMTAGGALQNYEQSLIDARMREHMFNQTMPFQHLTNQMNLMRSQGLASGSAPQPGMSPFQGAVQGAQGLLGLYGAYQDATRPSYVPPSTWGSGNPVGMDWSNASQYWEN
jgi:hypothetical protein